MGKTPEYSPSMQSFIDEQTNLYGATAQKYGLNVDEARKSGRKNAEWESTAFGGDLEQIREVYGSPSEADIAFRLGQERVSLGKQGLSFASQSEEALDFARQYVSGNIVSNNDKLMDDFETQSKIYQHIDSVDSPEGLQKILAGEDSHINSLLAGTSTNGTVFPASQQPTPAPQPKETPSHQPGAGEHGPSVRTGNPNDIPGSQEIKINTENAGAKIPIYHPATGASNAGLAADIGQALGLQPNDPKIAAAQTVLNPHSNIGQQNVPTHPAPTPQKQGTATGNGSSTQGGTPATGASSEPSAYAKAIKEENDRYTKETAGFDEKRKSLLRADGNQTEALKGLETERAVAARQHGINRIQNAMDAMQGTEAFGKLYETEHLQSSGITKTGFLTRGMHYASFTEEERNGFLKSVSKELGLTAEETKELKTASSSINQAYKNIWKQQAEIKSRYGESMKLVNSKDGLANMTTEQKIKHLGLTDKQVENLRKGLPMSRTGSVVDRARGFLSSTFSNVKDFFHGRMNMSNTTSSTYGQLQEARREKQLGQALDNMIIQRAKTGKWASEQTADRLAAIKRGDAAAIYDAAHAYDGPNANKTGALLREAPAAKAAAKKAAAETGGGSGIKWKGKVGAAAALLGLGAVFGTMMGHHGEQSNAQLYNPNPQPQYAN